ncbi:nitrogenase component 1 [Metaclostridioides mangenotii]|uniref:nitrogenase component 1 n=1 Tax=Metaclostridioides mangenotii TaxID=1540 RepID=UPI0028E197D8|nr:nitrogenase component 1 [Clostridioides mangenotii]
MNDFKHLKLLSEVKSNKNIKFLTPAVFKGNHCPMRIASVISEDIEGLSSLLVGMQECTTYSRLFSPNPEGKNGELHWLYVLDSHEVVFGCRQGLIDSLIKMDKSGVKAILLIVTCVPELIGEDIEGIICEIQPKLNAKVTFVMLGQFKNVSYPPGSRKTMEVLGMLMDVKETDPIQINVLGRLPNEEEIPMPNILQELINKGLNLRFLAPGASLEYFQMASDAGLNIVVSPYMQPLAVKMKKKFGIPYIDLHNMYDVNSIHKAYEDIADQFGLNLHDVFEGERQQALNLQNQSVERFRGLKYIFLPRVDMTIPLAHYLTKLEMEPLLLHLEEYYPEDKTNAKDIISMGHNPLICRIVNPEADLPILEKLGADLYFGFSPNINKNNIAYVPEILDFYGQIGYSRTVSILKRILTILDEKNDLNNGGTEYGITQI